MDAERVTFKNDFRRECRGPGTACQVYGPGHHIVTILCDYGEQENVLGRDLTSAI